MPSALLMLGRCYQKSDQPRHAKSYYERLIQEYPNKPEANIAESRLQAMETEEGG
jgi:TolA-binding protein